MVAEVAKAFGLGSFRNSWRVPLRENSRPSSVSMEVRLRFKSRTLNHHGFPTPFAAESKVLADAAGHDCKAVNHPGLTWTIDERARFYCGFGVSVEFWPGAVV